MLLEYGSVTPFDYELWQLFSKCRRNQVVTDNRTLVGENKRSTMRTSVNVDRISPLLG
jgi:hypothetical protein